MKIWPLALGVGLVSCTTVRERPDELVQQWRDRGAIMPDVATAFEVRDGRFVPQFSAEPHDRRRPTRLSLPVVASDDVRLEDVESGLRISVTLIDAAPSIGKVSGGYVRYAHALGKASLLQRPTPAGTEDFIAFDERPERAEVSYYVSLGDRVAGLRLVDRVLEVLDTEGTPRLRMARPFIDGQDGQRTPVTVAVEGCRVDEDGRDPRGRPLTAPGSSSCFVRLAWEPALVVHPALLDPSWFTTGNMIDGRAWHTATKLASGKVFVTGGGFSSTETFDPATKTWATGPVMNGSRKYHTASLLNDGTVFVLGGNSLDAPQRYSPTTGSWSAGPQMGAAPSHHIATVLKSGKIFVLGGLDDIAGTTIHAKIFDPVAGTWISGPTNGFVDTDSLRAALLASGKVLVVSSLSAFEIYDPSPAPTGTITNGARGWSGQAGDLTLLTSGKAVYVATSNLTNNVVASVYDPATGMWTDTATFPGQPFSPAIVGLGNGAVLLAGGFVYPAALNAARMLDPSFSAWSTIPSMRVARYGLTLTLLDSGDVLAAGGVSGGSSEIFTFTAGAPGARCQVDGDCASAHCSAGMCCDKACDTACVACTKGGGSTVDGTCMTVSARPGRPACAGGYLCDGVETGCPTLCSDDNGCDGPFYCRQSDHSCQPDKSVGAPCATGVECSSRYCVDGVCCSTACAGLCQACAAAIKENGLADGTCGSAKSGTNPHHDNCPVDPPLTCKRDGACDGAGSCRTAYAAGVSCGPSTCTGTTASGHVCDGFGSCQESGTHDCAPFLCVESNGTGGCVSSCKTSDDCGKTAFCNAGVCEARHPNGAPCQIKDACSSNICIDGRCCNAVCNGQCEACDVQGSEGTCVPAAGPAHGARTACAAGTADNPCSASACDGIDRAACHLAGGTAKCREGSCMANVVTVAAYCDGKGACPTATTRPCDPFQCKDVTSCADSCGGDADCAPGYRCDTPSHTCRPGASCNGHLASGADGKLVDCAPLNCNADGTCKTGCISVEDCASPNVCNADGKCVGATQGGGGGEGCGCRAGGGRAPSAWWALLALGFRLRCRARRRASGLPGSDRGPPVRSH